MIMKYSLLSIVALMVFGNTVYAHCQIPCGIYGDQRVFEELEEDIKTIEKSMQMIEQLAVDAGKNINQLVRWVNNKDEHADKIMDTVLNYFLAQRVKAPEGDDEQEKEIYHQKLELLHQIIVHAMKAKQTTDMEHVRQLNALLAQFRDIYFTKDEKEHLKKHHH